MSNQGSGQEWPQYGQDHGQDPVQDPAQGPVQDPYGTGQWQSYDKTPAPQSSFGPPQLPGPDSSRNRGGGGGAVLVAIGVILLIVMFAVLIG